MTFIIKKENKLKSYKKLDVGPPLRRLRQENPEFQFGLCSLTRPRGERQSSPELFPSETGVSGLIREDHENLALGSVMVAHASDSHLGEEHSEEQFEVIFDCRYSSESC